MHVVAWREHTKTKFLVKVAPFVPAYSIAVSVANPLSHRRFQRCVPLIADTSKTKACPSFVEVIFDLLTRKEGAHSLGGAIVTFLGG